MEISEVKSFNLPLGIFSFVVTTNDRTEFECNGLSKPPASISCYAQLHSLRDFHHQNLCSYIEIIRSKPERIFLVTECYTDIFTYVTRTKTDSSRINSMFFDCMKGLAYMSDHNLVHSFLNPSHILIDSKGNAKIAGYGVYGASDHGKDFEFPLADPNYSAPEVFIVSPICSKFIKTGAPNFDLNIACDIWSVGLIFFQIIHGHIQSNPLLLDDFGDEKSSNPLLSIRLLLEGLRQCENGELKTLPKFLNFQSLSSDIGLSLQKLEMICCNCLSFNALCRPRPQELLVDVETNFNVFKDTPEPHSCTANNGDSSFEKAVSFLHDRSVAEVYHYWLLTGGNVKSVWRSAVSLPRTQSTTSFNCRSTNDKLILPPLRRLPHYVAVSNLNNGTTLNATKHWPLEGLAELFSFRPEIIRLPGERLLRRLSKMSPKILYPLLIVPNLLSVDSKADGSATVPFTSHTPMRSGAVGEEISVQQVPGKFNVNDVFCVANTGVSWIHQPLSVREADIEYQVYRIGLFTRLLDSMPTAKQRLRLESRKDVPPFLRAKVWAALLGVHNGCDYRTEYVKALSVLPVGRCHRDRTLPPSGHPCFADTSMPTDTEAVTLAVNDLVDERVASQIAVDLPRCHGYDLILSSAVGQFKLRRVLVATLLRQPGYLVYTQGMDSIAAVFVRLCYPNDAMAAACLHVFLKQHLSDFFSSSGLTESLTNVFSMLLRLFAFHAPRLAARLVDLEVPLVGLTTGWIYTLFAHAMPLNLTELLWDFLISTPPVFVAFVYISVFVQLDRQAKLETLNLESICALLSNFPEISIDHCRADTVRWALATPVSLTTWPGMPQYPYPASSDDQDGEQTQAGHHLHTSAQSFYQQLCTPNAWPEHLEQEAYRVNTERSQESRPSTSKESTLVPMLGPNDALTHLNRPDCFVLDIRDKGDFARAHIPGSVNRSQSELVILATADTESDWEVIDDFVSDSLQPSRMIPKFLTNLMNEEAWQRAVDARFRAQQLSEARRPGSLGAPVNQPRGPGILMLLGYGKVSSPKGGETAEPVTAVKVADWLIHQDIDRVCVVDGGAPAILPHLLYS